MADPARVVVACSPAPREVRELAIDVPAGATVREVLAQLPWPSELAALERGELELFVWGRAARAGDQVRDQDRIELLRPLRVDPKVARRERFRRQGARAPGLFSRNRRP